MMLSKIFKEIIDNFPMESKSSFKNNHFANKMRNKLKLELHNPVIKINQNFDVNIIPGIENWFLNPKIELYYKEISSNLFNLKIYYFFDFENELIYLTLTHSMKNIPLETRDFIKKWIDDIVDKKYFKPNSFSDSFSDDENLPDFYKKISKTTLFVKKYDFSNLNEETLTQDLKNLFSAFEMLIPEYVRFSESLKSGTLVFDSTENRLSFRQNNLTLYEIETIKRIGFHEFSRLYNIYFDELEGYLCEVNITNLIAVLFMIFHTTDFENLTYCGQRIAVSDLYFIQNLALKYKSESNKKLSKNEIKRIMFLIKVIPKIYFMKDFMFNLHYHPETVEKLDFLSKIKYFFMNNQGYIRVSQMMESNIELYGPLEDLIFEKFGINFYKLIKMFKNLRDDVVANRIPRNKFFILSRTSKQNLEDIDIEYLINQDYYRLRLKDFIRYYPVKVNKNKLRTILNKMSIEVGQSFGIHRNKFILDDSVTKTPLIRLGGNMYAIPNIHLLFNRQREILYNLISGDAKLKKRFDKRKARYLEDRVEHLFKQKFSDVEVYKNLKFMDESGEIDVLVISEQYALMFECKSAKFRDKSKKDAIKSLIDDLDKLVKTPSEQTFRSKNKLVNEMRFKLGKEEILIDFSNIGEILRFNVTLDSLGTPLSKTNELSEYIFQDGGLKEKLTPSIYIGDLEIILDLLENDVQVIHYFKHRLRIDQYDNFEFSELDFLTAYQLNSVLMRKNTNLKIDLRDSFVTTLKDYYVSKDLEEIGIFIDTIKPAIRLTKLWKDMLSMLEWELHDGWFKLSLELLNFSHDSQRTIVDNYERLKSDLKEFDVVFWKFNNPHEISKEFVLFGFKDLPAIKQEQCLREFMAENSDNFKSDECLVLGVDFDKSYPYSFLKFRKVL